jgi:hypothetical protein
MIALRSSVIAAAIALGVILGIAAALGVAAVMWVFTP